MANYGLFKLFFLAYFFSHIFYRVSFWVSKIRMTPKRFLNKNVYISEAYKRADGIKIDGRRVIVDYERG
jgi:hypothetical protein